MKTFDIRVERPDNKFEDLKIGAEDLKQAMHRFESMYSYWGPFSWHGQVVFTDGLKPAEAR